MRRHEEPLDPELAAALTAIYDEANALYAGYVCDGTTECCRFGITAREPYVTSIELARLRIAIRRRGLRIEKLGQRPTHRRPLPLAGTGSRDERACPLLDERGRCLVYAERPFGCRTFYCDRARGPRAVAKAEVVALVARMKDLAARHEPGGDAGRPLTRALVAD